jgi:hypothetical protein
VPTTTSSLALAALAALSLSAPRLAAGAQSPADTSVIGRWDITVKGPNGDFPSWVEIRKSGNRALVGQFVGRVGSARPVAKFELANGTLRFSLPPQWEERNDDESFEATLSGGRLSGSMTDNDGKRLTWTAVRAPALRRSAEPAWGQETPLFDGKSLAGWHVIGGENQWKVVDGILTNTKAGGNLVTDATFEDFKLHAEFRYPKGGNSGIYLRGRYEAQIEDSRDLEIASDHLGGIYGFVAPSANAAKAAGEWQTYDITLVGRLVTVVLNGKTVICEREIPGITGGALDSNEGAPGPIFLQGDHGPVEFRRITITRAAGGSRGGS